MALLGSFIDVRTLAGLAAAGSIAFTHGLPAAPDFVLAIGAVTTASSVSAYMINALFDATTVTLQNSGEGPSPAFRVVSVVAHSVIR